MTAEPLTPAWLEDYRSRVLPQFTSAQKLLAEPIWSWFDLLWERDQVLTALFEDLREEVLPLLHRIEHDASARSEAIVEAVEALRSIDLSVLYPRL